jgi:hypothetical protein
VRRVRQLQSLEYISKVGGFSSQPSTMAGNYNIELETINNQFQAQIEPVLFAKFNSETMRGLQVIAYLAKGRGRVASVIESIKVFRIADGSWAETLIGSVVPTESSPSVFTANVSLAFLGANELSGAETYAFECQFKRRNSRFYKKIYLNHLGCFDSILRVRQQTELLQITKVDF